MDDVLRSSRLCEAHLKEVSLIQNRETIMHYISQTLNLL